MNAYYTVILFLHLLGVVVSFIGFGIEWTMTSLFRQAETAEQARSWLRVYKVAPPLTGPGLGLLILTGGYLGGVMHMMSQAWLQISLIVIVVAFLQGILIHVPRLRAIREAIAGGDSRLTDDARLKLANKALFTSVRLRMMLVLGIVYLMTVKPALSTSLVVVAVALGLGFFVSAGGAKKTAAA